MKVMNALKAIVDNADNKALNYAVNYAKEGLKMKRGTNEFNTQLWYVKSNITHWRGNTAKQVRKAISDELSR